MLYMVVEHFHEGAAPEIYRRVRNTGRRLPEGLEYIASWVDLEYTTCYQLMQTDDPSLFTEWADTWKDLIAFDIVPVRTSAEAAESIAAQL
jgi:hypothetical protein